MKLLHLMLSRAVWLMGVLGVWVLITGCNDNGHVTDVVHPAPGSGQTSTVTDRQLLTAVAGPSDPSQLQPVERVPRAQYGRVGPFPLQASDVNTFVYPSATSDERAAIMEGLRFFTTP